ncbi:hypothetical protein LTR78_003463 [Recurvomyces mirabilis]|uniref:Uncharacterized protein n=1 Tax=Recurvomyces mirabilis TaxID=574656 RepID=A0AAE0WRJ0_9PEZI|nr:hypothetical protein LTR78_003463 [Recurvomyces mirabilis]KAK5154503.1 hypothetical protein LTS14_006640 [Recurvomyces mirabilis]
MPPASSSLLCLPAKLRNRIYEYAMITNQRIVLVRGVNDYEHALIKVNKEIPQETLEVFYGGNTFVFEVPLHIDRFYFKPRTLRFSWMKGMRTAMVRAGIVPERVSYIRTSPHWGREVYACITATGRGVDLPLSGTVPASFIHHFDHHSLLV